MGKIDPINHYSMNSPASVYDEESLTAIELAARAAGKVNECAAAFNELHDHTNDKLNEIPEVVASDVQEYIEDGEFDKAIDNYAGGLKTRLNNLFDNLGDNPTVLDAELIDARLGADGTVYPSAGDATRAQVNSITRQLVFHPYENGAVRIDTVNKTVSCGSRFALFYGVKRILLAGFEASYASLTTNTFVVAYDFKDSTIKCVDYASFNNASQGAIFYVNLLLIAEEAYCISPYIGAYRLNGVRVDPSKEITPLYGMAVISPFSVEFDTSMRVVRIHSHIYVNHADKEFGIAPGDYLWIDSAENTKYMVVNPETGEAYTCDSKWYNGRDVIVFMFQLNMLDQPEFQTLDTYLVDGRAYGNTTQNGDGERWTCYVDAYNGNDTNEGTKSAPVATIQRAIDLGATTVKVRPGVYPAFNAKNRDELSIVPDYENANEGEKIMVRDCVAFGMQWGGDDGYDGHDRDGHIHYTDLGAAEAYRQALEDLFVKGTKPLMDDREGYRSEGYNILLYERGTTNRLTPVIGGVAMLYNENTFTYIDGTLSIHNPNNFFDLVLWVDKGSSFTNINKLTLEGIVFEVAGENVVTMENVTDATVKNCRFGCSSLGNGVACVDTNVTFELCEAYNNRNDGFNFHGKGRSSVLDCNAYKNLDDGISHHDDCVGVIRGGCWYQNETGIASPTYGAKVNIYDAFVFENTTNGIMLYDDLAHDDEVIIKDCVLRMNGVYGIKTTGYKVKSINNDLLGHSHDTHATNGSITEP